MSLSMKKLLRPGLVLLLVVSPVAAFADQFNGVQGLLVKFLGLLTIVLPIVVVLAFLTFGWGLVKFIYSSGEDKAEGKLIMIWGIIALFVMVSILGIIQFIQSDLTLQSGTSVIQIAPVPVSGS